MSVYCTAEVRAHGSCKRGKVRRDRSCSADAGSFSGAAGNPADSNDLAVASGNHLDRQIGGPVSPDCSPRQFFSMRRATTRLDGPRCESPLVVVLIVLVVSTGRTVIVINRIAGSAVVPHLVTPTPRLVDAEEFAKCR